MVSENEKPNECFGPLGRFRPGRTRGFNRIQLGKGLSFPTGVLDLVDKFQHRQRHRATQRSLKHRKVQCPGSGQGAIEIEQYRLDGQIFAMHGLNIHIGESMSPFWHTLWNLFANGFAWLPPLLVRESTGSTGHQIKE